MIIEATIRPYRPSDRPFVSKTWCDQMPRRFEANQVINRVLAHQTTRVMCAVQPSEESTIIGWLCYSRLPQTRLIHFAYTRAPMRKHGLMRQLVDTVWPGAERDGWVYTMDAPMLKQLLARHSAKKLPLDWALDSATTRV